MEMSRIKRMTGIRAVSHLACVLLVLTVCGLWLTQPVHGASNFVIEDYNIEIPT